MMTPPPTAPRPRAGRWYAVYAAIVIVTAAVFEWRGTSFTRTEQRGDVPKSVRSNPGTYRPVYVGGARYYSGK